jgi:hypothetical protein
MSKNLCVMCFVAGISPSIAAPISSATHLYRDGQQPVLIEQKAASTHTRPDDTGVADAFRIRYRALGSPRMAFFWNMQLGENFRDYEPSISRIQTRSSEAASLRANDAGKARSAEGKWEATQEVTMSQMGDRLAGTTRRELPIAESDLWKIESAFSGALREAGARLIDRTAVIRTTAFKEKMPDTHEVETAALMKHAELLLEVLMTPDDSAPLGFGFRVTLKTLDSGEERVSIYSQGQPQQQENPRVRYRGGAHGFEKVADYPQEASAEQVGRAVAKDLMVKILGSF